MWIPKGFAHGFVTLSEESQFLYKTTDFYAPAYERTILWNDAMLDIKWPTEVNIQLSSKDLQGSPLVKK